MKKSIVVCLLFSLLSCSASAAPVPPFKAAVVQFNPTLNERDKNIEALAAAFETGMKNGAKLLVAPEMSTTGYHYDNRNAIAPFVDTIPGKATEAFSKLTAEYGAYVVFGMAEVDGKTGLYYNSSALVGPEGVIGSYRKTHQWETEEHWSAFGDLGVPVFDTKLGRIAINICMDAAYPEAARLAALSGANIMAFPTNSTSQAIAALPARAMQNGLYILSANRSNTEKSFHMIGGSAIWSPDGECLASTPLGMTVSDDVHETRFAYADIDPAKYSNRGKDLLAFRRPSLYKDLMLHIGPWNYAKTTEPKELTALLVQFQPGKSRVANVKKMRRLIDEALSTGGSGKLDLIVLPELAVNGAAQVDGKKDADFFSDLAKARRAYVVGSFVEKEGKSWYITAALFDRDGNEVGRYRKTHLNKRERAWAAAGDRIKAFKTDVGIIGVMLGDEVWYPEIFGILSVYRADVIAVPSSWKRSDGGQMALPKEISANRYPDGGMALWDSVAMSAQAYTLIANYTGSDYFGGSGIYTLDPLYGLDQPVYLQREEKALLVKFRTVQPEWWFNQEMLINSRRTPYYMPLITE